MGRMVSSVLCISYIGLTATLQYDSKRSKHGQSVGNSAGLFLPSPVEPGITCTQKRVVVLMYV